MARCLLHWSCSEWRPTATFSGLTLPEMPSYPRYLMTAQRPLKRPPTTTARTKPWWITTTTTIIVWAKYELGFQLTKDTVIVSISFFSAQWPECNFFRIGIFYIFLCVWHLMYFIYYFLPKVFSYVWHIQSNIFVLPSYAYVYYLCHVKFLIFCEKTKKKL